MSADYFANAAYGVVLDEIEDRRIREALTRAEPEAEKQRSDWDDLTPSDRMHECLALLDKHEGYITGLRDKYGAGDDAKLIWTGDSDERPGKCHTEDDVFILGYGLYDFPGATPSEGFKKIADWHTWVEC